MDLKSCFRPLTGHGFHPWIPSRRHMGFYVSVPLRGMGFIEIQYNIFMRLILCFRPLTGHGFHHRDAGNGFTPLQVSVPLRGMGFIEDKQVQQEAGHVSVPLRGMGFIEIHLYMDELTEDGFRPLTGHGFHRRVRQDRSVRMGFRPLTGHGFHRQWVQHTHRADCQFPSPYGAWVSSGARRGHPVADRSFRPLTGHGFHRQKVG